MNNKEIRTKYNCKETTDYFDRLGHGCYDETDIMITTLIIGLIVILVLYIFFNIIPKRVVPKIKKRKKKRNKKMKQIQRS